VESLQAGADCEGLGAKGVGRSLQVLGSDVEPGAAGAWIGVGGSLGFWFWLLGRLQECCGCWSGWRSAWGVEDWSGGG
jgi:hypothetical protein